MTLRETLKAIREDLAFYSGTKRWHGQIGTLLFKVNFQTVMYYRLTRFTSQKRKLGFLTKILLYRQQKLSGCYIHQTAVIGRKLKLPHPVGIVIGKGARIGDGVTIYQHVTLGSHGQEGKDAQYPVVADGATLYANAVIIGAVHVGQNSVVGAGSVVLRDVPSDTNVAGVPARILSKVRAE